MTTRVPVALLLTLVLSCGPDSKAPGPTPVIIYGGTTWVAAPDTVSVPGVNILLSLGAWHVYLGEFEAGCYHAYLWAGRWPDSIVVDTEPKFFSYAWRHRTWPWALLELKPMTGATWPDSAEAYGLFIRKTDGRP